MKKTLKTLAVILAMILLLCACGKNKGTESTTSNNDNVSSYSDSSITEDDFTESEDDEAEDSDISFDEEYDESEEETDDEDSESDDSYDDTNSSDLSSKEETSSSNNSSNNINSENAPSDDTSSSDTSSKDDVGSSDSSSDEKNEDSAIDNKPENSTSSSVDKEENNDSDSEEPEEEEEEEEEYVIPPYIQEYEDTGIHDPVKVLTPEEMVQKCLDDGLVVKNTVIDIGLSKPVKIARITDSHLAYVNGADNGIAREQASIRYQYYVDADKKLARCVNYAKASGVDLVSFTGDIWDFFSMGNLYKFGKATSVLDDFLFSIGNHEDIRKVGGNLSIGDDFTLIRNTISQYVKNDLSFDTRDLGEVTVVSIDNSRYTFDDNQVEKMKAEIAKGKPIIIMMHTPLYTDELFEVAKENNDTGSIIGKTLTGATKEMVDLINANPDIIKGIFAGHLHYDHTSVTPGGITQYLLRASVQEKGFIEIIEVK